MSLFDEDHARITAAEARADEAEVKLSALVRALPRGEILNPEEILFAYAVASRENSPPTLPPAQLAEVQRAIDALRRFRVAADGLATVALKQEETQREHDAARQGGHRNLGGHHDVVPDGQVRPVLPEATEGLTRAKLDEMCSKAFARGHASGRFGGWGLALDSAANLVEQLRAGHRRLADYVRGADIRAIPYPPLPPHED